MLFYWLVSIFLISAINSLTIISTPLNGSLNFLSHNCFLKAITFLSSPASFGSLLPFDFFFPGMQKGGLL